MRWYIVNLVVSKPSMCMGRLRAGGVRLGRLGALPGPPPPALRPRCHAYDRYSVTSNSPVTVNAAPLPPALAALNPRCAPPRRGLSRPWVGAACCTAQPRSTSRARVRRSEAWVALIAVVTAAIRRDHRLGRRGVGVGHTRCSPLLGSGVGLGRGVVPRSWQPPSERR